MSQLMGVMCSGGVRDRVCFPERGALLRMRLMELFLFLSFPFSLSRSALVLCQ